MNPSPGGALGKSGLRFRDLHSRGINYQGNTVTDNLTQTNPFKVPAVLSVDVNGDVILVPDGNGPSNNGISISGGVLQLGAPCSNPSLLQQSQATLGSDRFIPLNTNSFNFVDAANGRIGIGNITNCNVSNTLELSANTAGPVYYPPSGANGASGLRLTFLTSAKTPVNNGVNGVDNTKVLSVDNKGDVVLVKVPNASANNGLSVNGGFVQLGADCNGTIFQQVAAILQTDRIVPLGGHILSFADGGAGRIGIGDVSGCTVNNTLELGANTASLYSPSGTNGSSGLRFTYLNSSNSPVTTNVDPTKVLSVDGNGDVVLINANGGAGPFYNCGSSVTGDQLPFDSWWEMNGHNFIFNGQGASGYNVGIGTTCTPSAKLQVKQSSGNTTSLSVYSLNTDRDGIAVKALSSGLVTGAYTKVAGWFQSTPYLTSNDQVAIFVPTGGGIVNVGYATPNTFYSGMMNVQGTIYGSAGLWNSSDSSVKHNINSLGSSLDKIVHLRPVTFEWDSIRDTLMTGVHSGFLAEEVNNIIPAVVRQTGSIKSMSYSELIPYVVKGIQEQQLSIDSLRANSGSGSSVPVASSGLSVNNGTVELGGAVGNGSYLNTDREIIGLDKTLYFTNNSQLSLNFPTGNTPKGALNVRPSHGSTYVNAGDIGIYTLMDYNTGVQNYGNLVEVTSQGGEIGVYAKATGITKFGNTGVIGHSIGGANGAANGANGSSYYPFIGVQGISEGYYDGSNYTRSIGGWFEANTIANNNIGVYATAPPSSQGSLNNWAGYFNGDVYLTGSAFFQGGPTVSSDQTLKTNIDTIANANQLIQKLKPRSFYYDTTNNYGLSFTGKKQYGLIAQDVQLVLPELVSTINKPADYDTAGNVIHQAKTYKSLNYNAFISILIKANQEQQRIIDSLKNYNKTKDSLQDARLTALENSMDNCCQHHNNGNGLGKTSSVTNIDVQLNNADIIVLNQNTPNPFAEQTYITYNIPQSTGVAQILFYDINGRQIKTVDITKKGAGQLTVYANDLTNGIYSYTLIADGKIIDTKKMIKQQ
ncbi:MAG: tail fiber domain-containing protein [Bacteroidia bacterium]